MKNHYKIYFILSAVIFMFALNLSGCVNYDQKTTLKEDGSGTMKIHYWTSMKNFSMGTTLGKFDFDESKAKGNYASSNTDVKSCKVEEKLDDSTKHVNIEVDFKDISKLDAAKGFGGVKVSWKESPDGMEFKYTVPMDTSASKQMGASDYKVTYSFEMPAEVVSTNGTKDGQTVKFNYTLSDLSKDLEMTVVTKKAKGKTCGIFGIISAIALIGLAYYTASKKKRSLKIYK